MAFSNAKLSSEVNANQRYEAESVDQTLESIEETIKFMEDKLNKTKNAGNVEVKYAEK